MAKKKRKDKWRDNMVTMYGDKCYLCGDVMKHPRCSLLPTGRGRHRATFDHVRPMCRGGSDGLHNKRLAHAICNTDKGDWTFTELLLGFKLK